MDELKQLLDFSKPLNVPMLDQAVESFFKGNMKIQPFLVQFKQHPQAWTRVDSILDKSKSARCKMIGLGILENTIQVRWATLPAQQRKGIRDFIVALVIKLSKEKETLQKNHSFITKLNVVLVQIVKKEWPKNWPGFIPELVNSSKHSTSLCTNNMQILKLLSEEVFDYSSGQMTQKKMHEMKKNLTSQFKMIFQLCNYVLDNSKDGLLILITLQTLHKFLHWIPVGFVFETKLIEKLALKFFGVPQFQNSTLQCLGEIGAIEVKGKPEYNRKLVDMYKAVMGQVSKLFNPNMNMRKIYDQGDSKITSFVRYMAIFITSFLKAHLHVVENAGQEAQGALIMSLQILLMISSVNDVVIWKICLEYWNFLVEDLFNANRMNPPKLRLGGLQHVSPRVQAYAKVLRELRHVMIAKMPRPEEVLIMEDENGQIVKETMKDTDAITLYKTMRDGLVYLTHLDPQDTQNIMLMKLHRQVNGKEWTWNNLNTLCWAIGSITGALQETQEKTFLVRVIKDLLQMCENKKGKDHKAVIASNIMYVVGQYPRFLRMHWKFLKTVVNKLFEFMHEKYEGVQDMSCDTFLKIAKSCRRKFVVLQEDERIPFIKEIIQRLPQTIEDLEQSQIHTFYQAVAVIVRAEQNIQVTQELTMRMMTLPNQTWASIIIQANRHVESLWDMKTVRTVINVLKTNNRVAGALEHHYAIQLGRIYLEMLQVYKSYSGYVSNEIKSRGAEATGLATVRNMRAVKKETLKLIQTFVKNSRDDQHEMIFKKLLPALLDPVLDDYKRNVPQARDAEVLLLIAELVRSLKNGMSEVITRILDSTFQCTLEMIKINFEDFPDVRRNFFEMIRAINSKCFKALLALQPPQFKLVMDSISWSVNHLDRTVAEIGLRTYVEMLENFANSNAAPQFYKGYYMSVLKEILKVLLDTFHKLGFSLHTLILQKLFSIVQSGQMPMPLWNPKQGNFQNNVQFVQQSVVQLIGNSFKTVTRRQAEEFMVGAFRLTTKQADFRRHIRDFLIQLKEFSENKEELFLEEKQKAQAERKRQEHAGRAAVPGLVKPQ
mmetsp:Transcript_16595/g.40875  ORF Transcript_16595/g.40875 Transcript_16595/m.40875 type:complete len:1055 (-) Transcript_16595:408-3572(-)|eukprot:CAMPEP_0114513696 /NCGR_PEP_ID=MMETSP0109-20121206/15728_1 /TAXON_ID=29199 /ORGANISM="Chlorarachnion reptans, Strain CCCM449" /LENGTH=1054 /DNA_ID=CAMNT_0001693627 /DNA_START=101 /DNA_END=3265 /DNA_ORIENTATION=-